MTDLLTIQDKLLEALSAAPANGLFVTEFHKSGDRRSVTFGEFAALVNQRTRTLAARGLRSGDRVIVVYPQGIELMAIFLGAMNLGAIPSILAYPNAKTEPAKYLTGLEGVSKHLEARMVILEESFPPGLPQIRLRFAQRFRDCARIE